MYDQHWKWQWVLTGGTLAILILVALCAPAVSATELYIPALTASRGQSIELPVMIDNVANLAGVKLVMKYDAKALTFRKGTKTKQTSSMMHIVNDKEPGVLIAVMAAARGIQAKDMPILMLMFDVKKDAAITSSIQLEITEVQLMSDTLKDIKCTIKIGRLTISGK